MATIDGEPGNPSGTGDGAAAVHAGAAEALRHGFGFYGLVYIQNHGIDADALAAFYNSFIRLTNLPTEEKQKLGKAEIWYQRGWTPPNTEKAVVASGNTL